MQLFYIRFLRVTALAGLAFFFSACSSNFTQRAQNANGLVGAFFPDPDEVSIPIEKVAGSGGRILTAHLSERPSGTFIKGRVAGSPGTPASGHVDLFVFDAEGKIVECQSVSYLPRQFPTPIHGRRSEAGYSARLATKPPAGATIRVSFHSGAKECPVAFAG